MLSTAIVALLATPVFAPPQPWALGFAAPPRIGMAGDVDNDGYADLIVVYPLGNAIVDVNLTVEGQKSGASFQGLNPWGENCQAATVGQFDVQPGADVAGIFGGQEIRLAHGYKERRFQDFPQWVKLPKNLEAPALATLADNVILAFSTKSGEAFRIDPARRAVSSVKVPKGTVWVGDTGEDIVSQDLTGRLHLLDRASLKPKSKLGEASKNSRPAAGPGWVAFGDKLWTREGVIALPPSKLPASESTRAVGDFDRDGDVDLIEYRYGSELHTAHQVLLRRFVSPGELDPDHDGLPSAQEASLSTDPLDPDTDNDGLLDGWEVNGHRGLDLPGLGCKPTRTDIICLVSRFATVKDERVKAEMDRVKRFYADLKTPNPDGTSGFTFHPIYQPPIDGDDMKNGWPVNRDKFRPEKWRGIVRWMQVTPGGGGQADQLGDGGTVGENSLWAVFIHEFGHQLGMDHEGFWPAFLCPTYGSLMNYAYSYSFEDDGNKIHYSDGALKDFVLRETDLDETIPLPYEKVKFLEKGPYRFRLKANGPTTLIDWNWNGVFGERNVRADINYSYSTNAGRRDDVGKAQTSPWLFVHNKSAYVLYGANGVGGDAKADPTLGPLRPGQLMLRKLDEPFKWQPPVILESGGLTGDPVAASFGGKIWAFYPTSAGISYRVLTPGKAGMQTSVPISVATDGTLVPTLGEYQGNLYLFLWNPRDGSVSCRTLSSKGVLSAAQVLDFKSSNPIGMCTDTLTGEAILATAQNQDDKRPNRWQVRRYRLKRGELRQQSMEWVEGESGQARGTGRLTVLFDRSKDAGPNGRIYIYGRGMSSQESPWACTYVAHQIVDKSVSGGWKVKRFYDEWTQSRSAPAAAWFGNDVIWSYRWVDGAKGPTDDNLHVGYRALGIEDAPMGDHDDLTFFRTFGIRNSILSLGRG